MAPINLRTKDGANQDRYILAYGSGINASPTVIGHTIVTDTGESGIVVASTSSVRVSSIGVLDVIQTTASALQATIRGEVSQANASALKATAEIYQLAPSALRATAEIYQATASALNATVAGTVSIGAVVDVKQTTASALNAQVSQIAAASGWTVRIVTPSGDTAMSTAVSAVRVTPAGVFDVIQATASALNATVAGTVSISGVVDVKQTTASALNATVVGAVEVRQSNASALKMSGEVQQLAASALKATAEVYQATASALNATVSQAAAASGWTVRVVTPSGDTAMDTSNSAVRVNLVAGGAGNGNIQDGVQSNLAATVKGYASGSPLMVALTDSAGAHIASLDVKQTTASALNATVVGAIEARQSLASAMQVTAEVRQATASALNATVLGAVEVRQASTSALKGIMEVFQATASALNTQAVGELAHDATDAGNPIKFGGKALEASPTNVGANDRVNAYFDKAGRLFTRMGHQAQDQWTATCIPGNTTIRATAVMAAGASGVRNVCTGLTVTLIAGSAAPAASYFNVVLLDGTSGTNVLWGAMLGIPATAGATTGITRTGLWIKSSQASALTLEFSGSPGTNMAQSVTMEGTTIVE